MAVVDAWRCRSCTLFHSASSRSNNTDDVDDDGGGGNSASASSAAFATVSTIVASILLWDENNTCRYSSDARDGGGENEDVGADGCGGRRDAAEQR